MPVAPSCIVIAGVNGSGKSTVHGSLNVEAEFVNADVLARQIDPSSPESASRRAAKVVLERLEKLIASRSDFVYETTLSGRQSLSLMKKAREAGYEVTLVFVVITDADLAVARVGSRVLAGGHGIAEATVRRRYERSFSGLTEGIRMAQNLIVYDNSANRYRASRILSKLCPNDPPSVR